LKVRSILSILKPYPILRQWGFLCCFFVGIAYLQAQKVTTKSWEATPYKVIEILSKDAYQINISTSPRENILLQMETEGEHASEVVLETFIKGDTLALQTAFRPFFQAENDKLAAHKVISIKLTLELPERLQVFVNAYKAHVFTIGTFQKVQLDLKLGNALLREFSGNARIHSWEGDIEVWAQPNVLGKGLSKYGEVKSELLVGRHPNIIAESVKGNISLRKTPD